MNIYISNLSYNTDAGSLQELFEEYGEVTSATVITDRETGRSRGFGFVEMPNVAEGQQAIDELNETELDGKTIQVNVARPKTERSSGGNSRGGGGFNRGGGGHSRGGGRGGYDRGGGYNKNRY
jgi:RNA recognition motif-containing protein